MSTYSNHEQQSTIATILEADGWDILETTHDHKGTTYTVLQHPDATMISMEGTKLEASRPKAVPAANGDIIMESVLTLHIHRLSTDQVYEIAKALVF